MTNPYQTPSLDPKEFHLAPYAGQAPDGWTWVNQIRIVGILNAVQGGLEILMGVVYCAMAAIFPALMQLQRMNSPNVRRPEEVPPEQFAWIVTAIYVGLGVVLIAGGGLRVFAGIQSFRFRCRILGIISLVTGLVSAITCYCLPTGLAMLIYGLIVYLNPAVATAFELGSQGRSAEEILAGFAPYRPPYGPPIS
jgi:hypothetical protein